MDVNDQLIALESRLDSVRRESDRTYDMLIAACDQITELLKRAALAEGKIELLAEKVYPTFYKVFPEAALADDALDKVVKEARKNRNRKS
jgi:hypothetical protein